MIALESMQAQPDSYRAPSHKRDVQRTEELIRILEDVLKLAETNLPMGLKVETVNRRIKGYSVATRRKLGD
jgi:hypothetical protein